MPRKKISNLGRLSQDAKRRRMSLNVQEVSQDYESDDGGMRQDLMVGRKCKGKSNIKRRQTRSEEVTRKRKLSEHTQDQNKRRRSERYNLRTSDSVIFVDETPCCKTPEQRKKYEKLGLNTALFHNSSQRPKRKQSHISIITVSSGDEEISEEWISKWLDSMNYDSISGDGEEDSDAIDNLHPNEEGDFINHQRSAEKEQLVVTEHSQQSKEAERSGISENVAKQQNFQPMCSSTPNTSSSFQSTMQNQTDKWNNPIESDPCTQNSAEQTTRDRQDTLHEAKSVSDLCSTAHIEKSKSSQDQFQTLEKNCSNTSTDIRSLQLQPVSNKSMIPSLYQSLGTEHGSNASTSSLLPNHSMNSVTDLKSLKSTQDPQSSGLRFYFGPFNGKKRNNPSVSIFDSNTSDGFKIPLTMSSEQRGTNELGATDQNINSIHNSKETKPNSSNEDDLSQERNAHDKM